MCADENTISQLCPLTFPVSYDTTSTPYKMKGLTAMDSRAWFCDAKFGMMVHWGLYSILAGEWQGRRMGEIGEWAQSYFRIPNSE